MDIRTKFSFNRYIEYTTVLMIFMQGFTLQNLFVVDLKLFYFFLISNSILVYSIYGIKIHKYLIAIILFISLHAVIVNLIYGIPVIYFIKQIIGISFSAIYFYNAFKLFDIRRLFEIYLKLSLIFCVIAIVFFPFAVFDTVPNRLDGLMTEPSKFVVVNIPALYFFIKQKKYLYAFILFLGFILAQSSVGFIAIFLIFILLFLRKSSIKYLGLTLLPLLLIIPYLQTNQNFQLRFKQTIESLNVFETRSFSDNTNASTFTLLKSAYIAVNNFVDHPLGTGIGSFVYQHDKYIGELDLPRYTEINGTKNLNREDANSLFLRLLSDLGVLGLFFVFAILLLGMSAFLKKYNSKQKDVCIGIFIYLLIKLLRMGHYFPEEMFFFLYLFLFNLPKISFKIESEISDNRKLQFR